jgi:DNA-binding HxlR family transcriptional regulator
MSCKPPVEVEYLLTPLGERFMRIVEEVRRLQEAVDRGSLSEESFADPE